MHGKEATVAQRLVRAKHKIREIRPPFAVPPPDELPQALDAVLEVLYAMFNEGHMAGGGTELVRRDVCLEAVRLARLVAEHPGLDTPGPTLSPPSSSSRPPAARLRDFSTL